jgi:hypothetical protein
VLYFILDVNTCTVVENMEVKREGSAAKGGSNNELDCFESDNDAASGDMIILDSCHSSQQDVIVDSNDSTACFVDKKMPEMNIEGAGHSKSGKKYGSEEVENSKEMSERKAFFALDDRLKSSTNRNAAEFLTTNVVKNSIPRTLSPSDAGSCSSESIEIVESTVPFNNKGHCTLNASKNVEVEVEQEEQTEKKGTDSETDNDVCLMTNGCINVVSDDDDDDDGGSAMNVNGEQKVAESEMDVNKNKSSRKYIKKDKSLNEGVSQRKNGRTKQQGKSRKPAKACNKQQQLSPVVVIERLDMADYSIAETNVQRTEESAIDINLDQTKKKGGRPKESKKKSTKSQSVDINSDLTTKECGSLKGSKKKNTKSQSVDINLDQTTKKYGSPKEPKEKNTKSQSGDINSDLTRKECGSPKETKEKNTKSQSVDINSDLTTKECGSLKGSKKKNTKSQSDDINFDQTTKKFGSPKESKKKNTCTKSQSGDINSDLTTKKYDSPKESKKKNTKSQSGDINSDLTTKEYGSLKESKKKNTKSQSGDINSDLTTKECCSPKESKKKKTKSQSGDSNSDQNMKKFGRPKGSKKKSTKSQSNVEEKTSKNTCTGSLFSLSDETKDYNQNRDAVIGWKNSVEESDPDINVDISRPLSLANLKGKGIYGENEVDCVQESQNIVTKAHEFECNKSLATDLSFKESPWYKCMPQNSKYNNKWFKTYSKVRGKQRQIGRGSQDVGNSGDSPLVQKFSQQMTKTLSVQMTYSSQCISSPGGDADKDPYIFDDNFSEYSNNLMLSSQQKIIKQKSVKRKREKSNKKSNDHVHTNKKGNANKWNGSREVFGEKKKLIPNRSKKVSKKKVDSYKCDFSDSSCSSYEYKDQETSVPDLYQIERVSKVSRRKSNESIHQKTHQRKGSDDDSDYAITCNASPVEECDNGSVTSPVLESQFSSLESWKPTNNCSLLNEIAEVSNWH